MTACLAADGFAFFGDEELVAPPLLWPESRSALHLLAFRGDEPPQFSRAAADALESAPIELLNPRALGSEAWRLAEALGWARTYDAEYLGLAHLLTCRVVTLDHRLRRGADRLGFVVSPSEL